LRVGVETIVAVPPTVTWPAPNWRRSIRAPVPITVPMFNVRFKAFEESNEISLPTSLETIVYEDVFVSIV
jgi:hypothetical protein